MLTSINTVELLFRGHPLERAVLIYRHFFCVFIRLHVYLRAPTYKGSQNMFLTPVYEQFTACLKLLKVVQTTAK